MTRYIDVASTPIETLGHRQKATGDLNPAAMKARMALFREHEAANCNAMNASGVKLRVCNTIGVINKISQSVQQRTVSSNLAPVIACAPTKRGAFNSGPMTPSPSGPWHRVASHRPDKRVNTRSFDYLALGDEHLVRQECFSQPLYFSNSSQTIH